MFDGILKITKHTLSSEYASQLGPINTGQAIIVTLINSIIVYFLDIAEDKNVN